LLGRIFSGDFLPRIERVDRCGARESGECDDNDESGEE
jgi:hypothetical protein